MGPGAPFAALCLSVTQTRPHKWRVACSILRAYILHNKTPLKNPLLRDGQYELMRYGAGIGEIWMNNLQCIGSESDLTDCQFDVWGNASDCTHEDDVSIRCFDVISTTAVPPVEATTIDLSARKFSS
jgi:hypothetical protein